MKNALGESVAAVTGYRVGKSCVYPYYDYHACRALRAEGKLSLGQWAASWIRATQPVLRWSDPMPALAGAAALLGRRVRSSISGRG